MDEVIRCTIIGVASSTLFDLQANPSGRQVWTGVRIRTSEGKTRFFTGMTVEAEASLILQAALDRGERVELWLTGKSERVYPYGIRTAAEEWYGEDLSRYLRGRAWTLLIFGILTLPLLGAGFFIILMALSHFVASSTFATRHSRRAFELGYEAGVLGQGTASTSGERLQVA